MAGSLRLRFACPCLGPGDSPDGNRRIGQRAGAGRRSGRQMLIFTGTRRVVLAQENPRYNAALGHS